MAAAAASARRERSLDGEEGIVGKDLGRGRPYARSRWLTLPVGLYIELAAGSAYAFGIYSSQLKHALDLNQTQLNLISSVGNIGGYFSLPGGVVFDRYGPRLTCLIGGIIQAVGYFMAFLASKSAKGIPSAVPFVAMTFAIAWHGGAWLDAGGVSVNLLNFPHDRGLVLGVLKSFFGLSGSIFAQVYLSFYVSPGQKNSNVLGATLVIIFGVANCAGRIVSGFMSDKLKGTVSRPTCYAASLFLFSLGSFAFAFATDEGASSTCPAKSENASKSGVPMLLFFTIACGALVFVSFSFLNLIPANGRAPVQAGQRKWIQVGYLIVGVLCISLAATSALQNSWESEGKLDDHKMASSSFVAVSLLLIASLLAMSMAYFSNNEYTRTAVLSGVTTDPQESENNIVDNDIAEGGERATTNGGHRYVDLKDSGEGQISSGVYFEESREGKIQHDGNPGNAMQVSLQEANMAQALQSADFYLLWLGQFCGTGAGLMTLNNLGQISTALGPSATIYVASVICGFAYGCFWCLNPILVIEMFGSKSFGSLYSLVNLAPALGSTAFSVGLAAHIYSSHERSGENCCLGQKCYQTTFVVSACLTGVIGVLSALAVAYRHRAFYRNQAA